MPIQYRSESINRSLAELHRQAPSVRGAAVISNDGLVIAAYPPGWDSNIHDPTGGENVAAMASVVVGQAERTMERLTLGKLDRVLMEGEHGIVGVFPISAEVGLALLIQKDAKLGLVLHAVRRVIETLQGVLQQEKES